jgi:hypothetical protein
MGKKQTLLLGPALLGLGAAIGFAWAKRAWLGIPAGSRSYRDLIRSRNRDSFSSPVIRHSSSDIDVAVAP